MMHHTPHSSAITDELIEQAARRYPKVVTGPMAGCKHPAALLRWVLRECSQPECRRLAEQFVLHGHGASWNAMCAVMPANAWLVWYAGDQPGARP